MESMAAEDPVKALSGEASLFSGECDVAGGESQEVDEVFAFGRGSVSGEGDRCGRKGTERVVDFLMCVCGGGDSGSDFRGQVIDFDQSSASEAESAFDDVAKFADVSGP